ncbi:MAG: putative secreted protein [Cryobacterium sp.]|nr:putative secreted protein [Cryobacterium sp.]
MLFETAVVATLSLSLMGAGATTAMPESSNMSLYQSVSGRLSDRQSNAGPSTVLAQLEQLPAASVDVDLASIHSMTGTNLLVGLAQLPLADVAAFAAEYPTHIDSLLTSPPEATVVTAWWTMLDPAQRASLAAATPRLVGNLDGVPLAQRSRANEAYLRESLVEATRALDGVLTAEERRRLTSEVAMLDQVSEALQASDDGPKRSLILLDTAGTGRAAIALGNPDTADYIGYLVPGMNYQVQPQMVNWTAVADDLYREELAVLAENASGAAATTTTASAGTGLAATATLRVTGAGTPKAAATGAPTLATIAWIGYEAPDLFSVGGLERAEAGADFLETSWAGVRATRGGDQPFVTVFAHSYGSTVSLLALAKGSAEIDALVVVGSPGSAIQSAAKLKVADGNVFVGKADWDPAVNSAFFGSDPGAASYGARVLGVHGGTDTVTGAALTASVGHNDYFKPGSESLHNMALIGTDTAELVTGDTE